MTIKNSELKFPIILNLILICFIYGDFLLPSKKISIEKFSSFNSLVTYGPSFEGDDGISISNTLDCQNGNFYRIARVPTYSDSIKSGEDIYLQKTLILSKIKSLENKKIVREISILAFPEIIIMFSLCLIVTLANIVTDKLPDFLLGFVSIAIYLVSLGYLFYFS